MIVRVNLLLLAILGTFVFLPVFAQETQDDSAPLSGNASLEAKPGNNIPPIFAELEKLLGEKQYDEAIAKIDEALKATPGDFRLIGIKSFVQFKYLNNMDESLATIDNAIAENPKLYDLYDFKINLYRASQLPDAKDKISEVYKDVARNFADKPLQLSDIGFQMLRNALKDVHLESAILLLRTAKENMKSCTESEKYIILTNLARGYYFASRADLALIEQAEAQTHANEIEKAASQQQLDFYREAAEMAKKLDEK